MRISDWSSDVCSSDLVGGEIFLLPGGYEVDGREIAPFDEDRMRTAAQACRAQGIDRIAVSSAFAPINPAMEDRAAAVIAAAHPGAIVSLSHSLGRLGLIEQIGRASCRERV